LYLGDAGGNSGITFTTPAAQTMSAGGSWNDNTKWTSRIPLPQDDVTVSGSSAVTVNAQRLGKSLDFSSYTGTITLASSSFTYDFFGSVTLGSGMSWGANPNTFNINASGRSSYTITSNGKAFFPAGSNANFAVFGPGGSYTLADAFDYRTPTTAAFNVTAGSFDSASKSMDIGRFVTTGTLTRSATWGTSTISLTNSTSSGLISIATSGLTWSASSSTWTVVYPSVNTTNRSLDLQGQTIGTFNYTVANSNAGLTITSAANFATAFNIGTGRALLITAGVTLTSPSFTLTGTSNGYIYAPGDNYMASAPDSAALSITGDMDFRQRMSFDTLAPTGSMRIAGKYSGTTQRTWRCYLDNAAKLNLDMSTTGADSSVAIASASLTSAGLSAGTTYWIRFTRKQSDGSVKFYYAADNASMPSSWTQIGTTQTATTSALFDSTALLTIGGEQGLTNPMPGRYYWSQLRNNILDDGTGIQFDANFANKTVGADTFTESSSNAATVTMNGLSVYGDGRLQIVSGTGGTKAFISKPSGGAITGVDYLKIQDIHMVQPLNFFTGANCTNVSGNSGIRFGSTGTYKHVQSVASTSATNTITATFSTATTAGNLLIAHVTTSGTTGGGVTAPSGMTQALSATGGSNVGYIYYKIATGSETSFTYSQTTARTLVMELIEYTGFSGTPTLDVTDSNTSGIAVTSLSTTASTGPTNTDQPALALALWGCASAMAAAVSITNSFAVDYTPGNASTTAHAGAKELTSLAAVDTTLTWTTLRTNDVALLAVFKNVASGTSKYLTLLGVG